MTFLPPHLLTLPLCVLAGLVAQFASAYESPKHCWDTMLDGKGGMPAARIGPAFLAVFLVPLFVVLISLLRIFTVAGLAGLAKGTAWGLTFGSLLDLASNGGAAATTRLDALRLGAGRGALAALLLCIWVAWLNPALSRLGKRPIPFRGATSAFSLLAGLGFVLTIAGALLGAILH